jgi:hypothetical protein
MRAADNHLIGASAAYDSLQSVFFTEKFTNSRLARRLLESA